MFAISKFALIELLTTNNVCFAKIVPWKEVHLHSVVLIDSLQLPFQSHCISHVSCIKPLNWQFVLVKEIFPDVSEANVEDSTWSVATSVVDVDCIGEVVTGVTIWVTIDCDGKGIKISTSGCEETQRQLSLENFQELAVFAWPSIRHCEHLVGMISHVLKWPLPSFAPTICPSLEIII